MPTDHELKLLGSKLDIKKNIFIHCYSFFFITPTYFVILNFVSQIIPGTSAGRGMLLFICLAFFYFHNAETSQCASMENQHTGIDSTLASIDRSVLCRRCPLSMDYFWLKERNCFGVCPPNFWQYIREQFLTFYDHFTSKLACMTGALWAKRGERVVYISKRKGLTQEGVMWDYLL